jgi:hypothetical protein
VLNGRSSAACSAQLRGQFWQTGISSLLLMARSLGPGLMHINIPAAIDIISTGDTLDTDMFKMAAGPGMNTKRMNGMRRGNIAAVGIMPHGKGDLSVALPMLMSMIPDGLVKSHHCAHGRISCGFIIPDPGCRL